MEMSDESFEKLKAGLEIGAHGLGWQEGFLAGLEHSDRQWKDAQLLEGHDAMSENPSEGILIRQCHFCLAAVAHNKTDYCTEHLKEQILGKNETS